ncbi:hypothetical protein CVT25_012003 [Psilocybe cyanescens]|uniref:Uncharacterized protein n=1 Tax=Psilocybe cyanescens TaxID=93625 RepID=A0A409XFG3_PSICY|nr:hypothetical protein CVT25_012003 [Psilocybe cyanescens]
MRFSAKIASLMMALATCSVMSAHGSVVVAREAADGPFIILYHERGFEGDGFSPTLSDDANYNLPPEWVDKVGSVNIQGGRACIFFTERDAHGLSTVPLEGPVPAFFPPFLDHIKSLTCWTLREAFWKARLPNVMPLISTAVIIAVLIYLEGFRVKIPGKSNRFRGQRGMYPSKLHSMLTSNASLPFAYLPSDLQPLEDTLQLRATGGISYYMLPPHTLKEAVLHPIHIAINIALMLSVCVV